MWKIKAINKLVKRGVHLLKTISLSFLIRMLRGESISLSVSSYSPKRCKSIWNWPSQIISEKSKSIKCKGLG